MNTRVHFDLQHKPPAHRPAHLRRISGASRAFVYEACRPGQSISDEQGFRKDVLEALRALDMPVVRYPGGNL